MALLRQYEDAIEAQHGASRGNLHGHEPMQLTGFGLRYLCEDPALDWVVSTHPIQAAVTLPIIGADKSSYGTAYFYRCVTVRQVKNQ